MQADVIELRNHHSGVPTSSRQGEGNIGAGVIARLRRTLRSLGAWACTETSHWNPGDLGGASEVMERWPAVFVDAATVTQYMPSAEGAFNAIEESDE